MLTRILTSIVGIPLVVLVVLMGGPIFRFTVMAASLIGLYEFYNAVKNTYHPMKYIGYAAVVIYYVLLGQMNMYFTVFVALLIIVTFSYMVIVYPKYNIMDVSITIIGMLYVSVLFGFIVMINNQTAYGDFWVWLIIISSWGSDTCAYFVGKTIGKHKLAPVLSPKKTVEGSIGGIVGAGILGYIYTIIYTQFHHAELSGYAGIVVVAVCIAAIISQFGDLAASAIKRTFEQKDYGNLLPGHGGILDRCDSILFVAPIIYGVVVIAEYMIR